MKCKYLIVSSITYAMKAKGVLEKNGIFCKIEKIKNIQSLKGCGFGLKVASDLSVSALRYVNFAGINVLDVIDCEADTK